MISKKTVFVLGAGASKPFGFPTGFELREQICSLLSLRSSATIILEEGGYIPDSRFTNFVNSFLKSGLNSIDAFLSRNANYADFGTAAIAACLMTKENYSTLYAAGGTLGNSDWYGLLWNCLVDQVVDIKELRVKNDISFITFNYDRSLEAFLLQAAISSFSLGAAGASEVCKQIKIYHMYGSFGDFDWQDHLPYGLPDDRLTRNHKLRYASGGIKVVPAQRQESADPVAQKMLSEAEQIVFLGFGFDSTNCARLGLPYVVEEIHDSGCYRSIFMTAMGMSGGEIQRAINLVSGQSDRIKESVRWNDKTCYTALREWGILLG
jgi:hypothetical protein